VKSAYEEDTKTAEERIIRAKDDALKTELAAQRIRHARAVSKVAVLERGAPTSGLAAAMGALLDGSNPENDRLASLEGWRIKRDVAAEAVRYLEGRLGTVLINAE